MVTDNLGTPRLLVNGTTGAVAQRFDVDEWGQVTSDSSAGFQVFGFAGSIYDPNALKKIRDEPGVDSAAHHRWSNQMFFGRLPPLFDQPASPSLPRVRRTTELSSILTRRALLSSHRCAETPQNILRKRLECSPIECLFIGHSISLE